jgi:hypothetical protein
MSKKVLKSCALATMILATSSFGSEETTVEKAKKDTNKSFIPSEWVEKGGKHIGLNLFTEVSTFQAENNKEYFNLGLDVYFQLTNFHLYANAHARDYRASKDSDKLSRISKGNLGVFFPIMIEEDILSRNNFDLNDNKTKLDTYTMKWGPIFEGSYIKNHDEYSGSNEMFFGSRVAFSPNRYFDIMYGKVSGLADYRIKYRAEWQIKSSVIMGIEATQQVENRENIASHNQDTFKFYFKVPVSIDSILKVLSGK